MLKVLVTGGFGSVGRWIVRELVARGHEVSVFELDNAKNRKTAKRFDGVRVCWGNLTDAQDVAAAVHGQDAIIHLACLLPPMAEENPTLSFAVNVEGTQHVIDACLAQDVAPRLVHASSGEVYGATRHLQPPRRVDDPHVAVNHYSADKIKGEARVAACDLDYVIVRFSAVIDIALANSHPLMFEFPVDVRMEVLHAADAAFAIANCLETEEVWGRQLVLPLAGGESCRTTYGGFLTRMLEALGVGGLPAEAFTTTDYPSDWHDTEESQRLLQYQRHTLDDICADVRTLLGWRRFFVPLARWGVRRSILAKSPYMKRTGG
ncbi:MAG: NAD(P)-dependent oxidoreductase [Myxococcales bacterium]|nr:NAD(P)-dependent oxidoreductase [Myxococcales bacterium]